VIDLDPDSQSSSGKSGARRFFERVFENVDNPLGWSVRLFVARGIDVRLHLFTALYILGTLLTPLLRDSAGFAFVAYLMASLFLVVLLHEIGHCVACRAVGGVADRIVLLPFGGLALCRPPHDWRSDLITTVGGPAVNLALLPITSALLLAFGMGGQIVFNPFDPYFVMGGIEAGGSVALLHAKLALWSFHYINIVILGFNVLLPFFPLDGGRIVQAVLWSRSGYRKSMDAAILIGFAGAGVLAVIALISQEMLLLLIAIFGAVACFVERQRLAADAELAELNLAPGATGLGGSPGPAAEVDDEPAGPTRRELKQQEREEKDAEELDRLLAKISASGMESLGAKEKRTLDRLSQKKRKP
jgi:stage IV sporulation protein FB